jgi:predicted phage terminase large subunit-like protein
MGTEYFAAQYLQSPTPPGGGIVKLHWLNPYDPAGLPAFTHIVQSWDCASKAGQAADYSVCTTWGVTQTKSIYLLHVFRDRLEYPALRHKVREMAFQHRATVVLIEDTASGTQLIQELRREGRARFEAISPRHDKVTRMTIQTPALEAGKVLIPKEAAWLDDYLHELAMFPKGKYDDQVDSTSQALDFIAKRTGPDNLANCIEQLALHSHTFGLSGSAGDNWFSNYLGGR